MLSVVVTRALSLFYAGEYQFTSSFMHLKVSLKRLEFNPREKSSLLTRPNPEMPD